MPAVIDPARIVEPEYPCVVVGGIDEMKRLILACVVLALGLAAVGVAIGRGVGSVSLGAWIFW